MKDCRTCYQLPPSALNTDSFISIHKASPPFFSLAIKPKHNEYFMHMWLMEHSGSSPLGTLHNGVLTASQCNISVCPKAMCLPAEPEYHHCLVSPVPVFGSRAGSFVTALCHHCASSSKLRQLAQVQRSTLPSVFEVCISGGVRNACTLSPSKINTGISNHITE